MRPLIHQMPKRVALIDMVFPIEGRGTVISLLKDEHWSLDSNEAIYPRKRIQIRKPDGSRLSTLIKDIDAINRGKGRYGFAFSLPKEVAKADIPDGSELWLERDGTEPLIEHE